jgi:hypothetical protein
LERLYAERVLDLENGKLPVGSVGLDQKFPVLTEEARADAVVGEARIVESPRTDESLAWAIACL